MKLAGTKKATPKFGVAFILHRFSYGPSHRAFARREGLFLATYTRLFVVFALSELAENTGLFTLLLETADGALDWLAFFYSDSWHGGKSPPLSGTDRLSALRTPFSSPPSLSQPEESE
jgi:hypothetical protein